MTSEGGRGARPGIARRLAPYAYLFVITMLVAGTHIARYTEYSPIDELRHVDYAMRASKLDFPRYGDLLVQESMREEACRGVDLDGYASPPCKTKVFEPPAFRDDGYQIASIHPPTYYLGAGWFARVAMGIGISESFVDPARVFSALLVAIGLMVTFAAGRLLGVGTSALLAALTFVPLMPSVLLAGSTVNPDSTALLVGAVVLFVALLWERGRLPMIAMPVVGVVATGLKFTSILAALVVAGVFVVKADPIEMWHRVRRREPVFGGVGSRNEEATGRPRSSGQYLLATVWLLGAALLVAAAWSGIDHIRAVVDPIEIPQVRQNLAHGIPELSFLLDPAQVFAWLPPSDGYETSRFISVYTSDVRMLTTFLFAGATLVAALRVNRRDDMSLLAVFALGCAVFGGPAYVAVNAVVQDVRLTLPARYGISLLPIIAIVVASFVATRIGAALLWVGAVSSFVIVLATMLIH